MKFISSNFWKETGKSRVIMQHLGKKFFGFAYLHPDDKPSEYTGCSLAEKRATIKALKYERKIAKEDAENARLFVRNCESYTKFNKEDDSARCMYRQLNKKIKRVNDLTDEINALYDDIYREIHVRERILKKLNESKEDNL